MRLTLTAIIDIDDDELAERLEEFARLVEARARPEPAPGPHPAGPAAQSAESRQVPEPDRPRTGRELYRWASDHRRLEEAKQTARRLKFGGKLIDLGDEQAAEVYAEMHSGKPRKGAKAWGSEARP